MQKLRIRDIVKQTYANKTNRCFVEVRKMYVAAYRKSQSQNDVL